MTTHPLSPSQLPFNRGEAEVAETKVEEVIENPITKAWGEYTSHLKKWFYDPDIEAASIVLSACAAQFHKGCDPVWLFVLGPSSSEKSSICINSIATLPQVWPMGEITSKTFLSGYTGTAHPSLLHQVGSGILAFKDFTTFASARDEEQAIISSQFREIFDGEFHKRTGKGIPIDWVGKITVIAAGTSELERKWSLRRALGERFIQIRISRRDGIPQAEFAQRQRGMEEFISKRMKELALSFFQVNPAITNPPPELSSNQMSRVAAMADLLCYCRGMVPRNSATNAVCGGPEIEGSPRVAKSIASVISNHAAIFRRRVVDEGDMNIGKRVTLNSIPSNRMGLISLVPITGSVGKDRLQISMGLPSSTVANLIEDLEILGVLKVQHNEVVANEISLSPLIARLWAQAFDPLASAPLALRAGAVAH